MFSGVTLLITPVAVAAFFGLARSFSTKMEQMKKRATDLSEVTHLIAAEPPDATLEATLSHLLSKPWMRPHYKRVIAQCWSQDERVRCAVPIEELLTRDELRG